MERDHEDRPLKTYSCEDHDGQVSETRERCPICDKWFKTQRLCDICPRYVWVSGGFFKWHRKEHFKDFPDIYSRM